MVSTRKRVTGAVTCTVAAALLATACSSSSKTPAAASSTGGGSPSSSATSTAPVAAGSSSAVAGSAVAGSAVGSSAAASTAAASEATGKNVTLTYWTHSNPPSQVVEKDLIAQYEAAHPNVKVNYVVTDFGSLATKVTTALASGTGPDLMNLFGSYAPDLARDGELAPVDFAAFGVGDSAGFAAKYPASIAQGYVVDGKTYGVPHEISGTVFYVNAASLQAAGIDATTQFPKTWEEVVADGAKLTTVSGGKTQKEGVVLPLYNGVQDVLMFDMLSRQEGGGLFSADGKTAQLNSAASVKALQFWGDLHRKDHVTDPALGPTATTDVGAVFGSGTAAMTPYGGTATIDALQSLFPKVYANYAVGEEPTFTGGPQVGGDMFGFGLYVPKASKNQAAAWQFASFLEAHSADYFTKAGIWLGDNATLNSSATASFPHWNVFATGFKTGNFLPAINHYNEVSAAIEKAIEAVVLNGTSAQSALDQAQKTVVPLLK